MGSTSIKRALTVSIVGGPNNPTTLPHLPPGATATLQVRVWDSTKFHTCEDAITGDGIPELRAQILKHLGGDRGVEMEGGFLTNARHRALVDHALAALDAASRAVENKVPHEMLLLDLYTALGRLDEITGATTTDDILNLIFSSFCIGK